MASARPTERHERTALPLDVGDESPYRCRLCGRVLLTLAELERASDLCDECMACRCEMRGWDEDD